MKTLVIIAMLIMSVITAHGTIFYVTVTGSGTFDGSSWANALPGDSLNKAINLSASGDQVWVATGMFKPTTGTSRDASFAMKNGVAIYGSFAGTETVLADRVLTNGLTSILSGEIGSAGIADNCYHVINNTALNNTALINGFIIRDVNDNRVSTVNEGLGGGFYNNGSGPGGFCSPTISNCVITNNRAVFGAGIFNNGYSGGTSSPVISECVITGNTATSGGGGIDNFGLSGNANPIITNCIIAGNTAIGNAGGMYCWGGSNGNANPVVTNCVFTNNAAVNGGGIVSDRQNATSGNSGNSNPNFRNCIFWGNTASSTGPQFYNLGGATFIATYTDIDLTGQSTPHIISGAGTGNVFSNPLFLNAAAPSGADEQWMTVDDGLRLSGTGSPAYNAGNNAVAPAIDLLSANRIQNGTIDMGVYELDLSTLLVTFSSFSGSINDHNEVKLSWYTTDEQHTVGYEILRSTGLRDFKHIGFVKAKGSSNGQAKCTFTDLHPAAYNYYRIKETAASGRFTFSNVVALQRTVKNVHLFPNPSNSILNISGLSNSQSNTFKIIGLSGVIIKTIRTTASAIDISELPPGGYFLCLEAPHQFGHWLLSIKPAPVLANKLRICITVNHNRLLLNQRPFTFVDYSPASRNDLVRLSIIFRSI